MSRKAVECPLTQWRSKAMISCNLGILRSYSPLYILARKVIQCGTITQKVVYSLQT